jgi:hypothetical protein
MQAQSIQAGQAARSPEWVTVIGRFADERQHAKLAYTPQKQPTRPRIGHFTYVQLAVGLTPSRRLRRFLACRQTDQIVERRQSGS